MLQCDRLDLRRGDRLPAPPDCLAKAPVEAEHPIVAPREQVAGAVPAVAGRVERGRAGLGIPLEDDVLLEGTDAEFAGLPGGRLRSAAGQDPGLEAIAGNADSAGHPAAGAGVRPAGCRLRLTPDVLEDHPESALECLPEAGRRRAAHRPHDRIGRVVAARSAGHERADDGSHVRKEDGADGSVPRPEAQRLEAPVDHRPSAAQHGPEQRSLSGDMEERKARVDGLATIDAHELVAVADGVQRLGIPAPEDTLGLTGRPRGEHQPGRCGGIKRR